MIRKIYVDPELPITTAAAREALRIRHNLEEVVLARKLRAAVEFVESRTTRLLRRHVLELVLDDWPTDASGYFATALPLPAAPIREVVSLEYRAAGGAWVEVAADGYDWRRTDEGGELFLLEGTTIPALSSVHPDRLRVRFEAGYEVLGGTGTGDDPELDVPERAIELVLLLAGHWYENREAVTTGDRVEVPLAAKMLLDELRIYR